MQEIHCICRGDKCGISRCQRYTTFEIHLICRDVFILMLDIMTFLLNYPHGLYSSTQYTSTIIFFVASIVLVFKDII